MGSGVSTEHQRLINIKIDILRVYYNKKYKNNGNSSDDYSNNNDDKFMSIFNNDDQLILLLYDCIHEFSLQTENETRDIFRIEDSHYRTIDISPENVVNNDFDVSESIKFSREKEFVIIKGDGIQLTSLDLIVKSKTIANYHMKLLIMGLDLSNNLLSNESIPAFAHPVFHSLRHLGLASNCNLSNVTSICISCPTNLQVLDLSYSENLIFQPRCFIFCPQLKVLILDGCNIASTSHNSSSHGSPSNSSMTFSNSFKHNNSMFYGLVRLEELSLKENQLGNEFACQGLTYFGKRFSSSHHLTLRILQLNDNPCLDKSSMKQQIKTKLIQEISSLLYIDDIPTSNITSDDPPVDFRKVLSRNKIVDSSGVLANSNHLDSLETEYLSALKGERDTNIIS